MKVSVPYKKFDVTYEAKDGAVYCEKAEGRKAENVAKRYSKNVRVISVCETNTDAQTVTATDANSAAI